MSISIMQPKIKGYPIRIAFTALVILLVSACSGSNVNVENSSRFDQTIEDPHEGTNRAIFKFNKAIDKVILKPLSEIYRFIVPKPLRMSITNVLANLMEPWNFTNAVLQGEGERANVIFQRFLVNSTVGVGGLIDTASELEIPKYTEDFGQTLATWGVGEGVYLVLPFLGPSDSRDAFGVTVDLIADPANFAIDAMNIKGAQLSRIGATVIDLRTQNRKIIDSLYEERDPYILARSAYIQARRNAILNGKAPEPVEGEEDLFDDIEDLEDFDDEEPSSPPENETDKDR